MRRRARSYIHIYLDRTDFLEVGQVFLSRGTSFPRYLGPVGHNILGNSLQTNFPTTLVLTYYWLCVCCPWMNYRPGDYITGTWKLCPILMYSYHAIQCAAMHTPTEFHRGGSRDLLSSFQAACLSRMRTVGSSRRVSSDATAQIFAKVSNFPSWWPKPL